MNEKDNVDTVAVIGSYVKLKLKGKNRYIGLCPFHNDHHPSFNVYEKDHKHLYKCFSCNESGDVFNFIMKMENVDFANALKVLNDKFNYQFNSYMSLQKKELEENKFYYEKNLEVANIYHKLLLKDKKAYEYLTNRKISLETINKFLLGYAPYLNGLKSFIKANENNYNFALDFSLLIFDYYKDNHYDFFRNRIMIPIKDQFDNIIGFTARTLNKKEEIKYLNTAKNSIFQKGSHLYGYEKFLKIPSDFQKTIILVEGFLDVISLHEIKGIKCAGLMCANITDEQINLLKKNKNLQRIILALDKDKTGFHNTLTIYERLNAEKRWEVLLFNNWKDHSTKDFNDVLVKYDKNGLLEIINDPKNITDIFSYCIDYFINNHTSDQKDNKLENCMKLYDYIVAVENNELIVNSENNVKLKDYLNLNQNAIDNYILNLRNDLKAKILTNHHKNYQTQNKEDIELVKRKMTLNAYHPEDIEDLFNVIKDFKADNKKLFKQKKGFTNENGNE